MAFNSYEIRQLQVAPVAFDSTNTPGSSGVAAGATFGGVLTKLFLGTNAASPKLVELTYTPSGAPPVVIGVVGIPAGAGRSLAVPMVDVLGALFGTGAILDINPADSLQLAVTTALTGTDVITGISQAGSF